MRNLGQPIASQLASARVLIEQEVNENYPDGKVYVNVSRGYQKFLVGTTPTVSGSDYVFTRCTGDVTVTPTYGGTLSLLATPRLSGIC